MEGEGDVARLDGIWGEADIVVAEAAGIVTGVSDAVGVSRAGDSWTIGAGDLDAGVSIVTEVSMVGDRLTGVCWPHPGSSTVNTMNITIKTPCFIITSSTINLLYLRSRTILCSEESVHKLNGSNR